MKKFILSENGTFHKVNLHCHSSDCSDGKRSLAEIKEFYKSKGYSAVAFSDHNVLVNHTDELTDENFIALTATEINVNNPDDDKAAQRTYHINLIAKKADNDSIVCFNPKYVSERFKETQKYVGTPDFERVYSAECVNKIISEANENGFLAIYNHPRWALQTWEDYHELRGLFGMEVCNGDCVRYCGRADINEDIYDWFLRQGIDICAIAADDNHNLRPAGHPKFDSGTAWVTVKTDRLDYESIISALENKNFYASNGPEIKECYIDEEDYIVVKTSPCEFIRINTQMRAAPSECGEKLGDAITECRIKVPDGADYVRVTVTDFNGKQAWTNAFYLK